MSHSPESNREPLLYKSIALPIELEWHIFTLSENGYAGKPDLTKSIFRKKVGVCTMCYACVWRDGSTRHQGGDH